MPRKIELPEATDMIGQINTLDGQIVGLISSYDQTVAVIEANNKEIERLGKLRKDNDTLKANSVALLKEAESMRAQRDSMHKELDGAGWKFPLPERKIVASAMRM